VSAVIGSRIGAGAAATFVSSSQATTGTMSFARLTAAFGTGTDDLGAVGGVGGASYVMTVNGLLVGTSVHRYTTLTNTGSVTENLNGTLMATAPTGTMTVAVHSCSQAWALGGCGGTTTVLRAAIALSGSPTVAYGSLTVSGVTFLRYTFTATSVVAGATITASAVPTGTGLGNRTAG
jgi:hypothetical protein